MKRSLTESTALSLDLSLKKVLQIFVLRNGYHIWMADQSGTTPLTPLSLSISLRS